MTVLMALSPTRLGGAARTFLSFRCDSSGVATSSGYSDSNRKSSRPKRDGLTKFSHTPMKPCSQGSPPVLIARVSVPKGCHRRGGRRGFPCEHVEAFPLLAWRGALSLHKCCLCSPRRVRFGVQAVSVAPLVAECRTACCLWAVYCFHDMVLSLLP